MARTHLGSESSWFLAQWSKKQPRRGLKRQSGLEIADYCLQLEGGSKRGNIVIYLYVRLGGGGVPQFAPQFEIDPRISSMFPPDEIASLSWVDLMVPE